MERRNYFMMIITAGVIMALLCAVPAWTNWIFNYKLNGFLTFFYQVAAIFAVLYIYGKRVAEIKATENGYTFGQAFGFAFFVSIVAGLVAGCLSWLLITIDPTVAEKIMINVYNEADKLNMQGEDKASYLSNMKFLNTTFSGLILLNIFSMVISGGIMGLISSALVQRKPQI